LMWVFSSFVYLLPAVAITLRMLSPQGSYQSSSYDPNPESTIAA
jgi:hypothetical protein